MEGVEDARARRRLMDLVDEATVSPAKSLDVGLLHSIKALVRSSEANVHTAFDALFDKLKKNHSQVCASSPSRIAIASPPSAAFYMHCVGL